MLLCSRYLMLAGGRDKMKQLFVVLFIFASCVFAKTWSSYTSIGIEPFAKDSVLYLGFGKDSIEILKNIDNYEGLYIDYHLWYSYADDIPEPFPVPQYSFYFAQTKDSKSKDSVRYFTRWADKGARDYVSMDSVISYKTVMEDFEICDIDEYTCTYAFHSKGFYSVVDSLTIKLYKIPLHDYIDTLINVVSDVSLFLYKKVGAYNAACYVFSLDNYMHVVLSCQYQDDGTLNFDKMIPIKREDILKIYEKSLNPDRNTDGIKAGRMKSTMLNKREPASFLINGIRKKNNSSNVIIKNQTPMLQLK